MSKGSFLKEHKLGIVVSLFVALLFLLPHLLIPLFLDGNKEYSPLVIKGVDGRVTDEILYASFVQEASNGRIIGASTIAEAENKFTFSHVGTAIPAIILGFLVNLFGSITIIYIFAVAFFTLVSSLLIYWLSFILTKNKGISVLAPVLLFFSPTYILKFLTQNITQPVSYFSRFYAVLVDFPFFIGALISLYFLLKKRKWYLSVLSGILGGALFYIYFYF